MVDTAQRTGQNRATPIKGVAVDGLPVVHYLPGVFADQVWLHFLDGGLNGQRAAFQQRLAQSENSARIGMNF